MYLLLYSVQLKQIIIVMSDHCSISSQLDSECNKLTNCQTTGWIQTSESDEVHKNLISWRSNVTLNETDSICYHHEKMFLTRYEGLQKYCSEPFAPHILKVSSKYEFDILDGAISCTIILFLKNLFMRI